MTQQTPFFPLGGGLDLITPAIAMKPGKAIGALNYEPLATGYQRVMGFERYDGRTKASEAPWLYVTYDGGSLAGLAGQTVTGLTSGATGKLLQVPVIQSGTIGASNAAGYFGLWQVTGTFIDNETLRIGGINFAVVNGAPIANAAPDDPTGKTWKALATANQRALILAVPGQGPVRGVWIFKNARYAIRDNVGATAGVMHKATAAGWVAQSFGRRIAFTSGGTVEALEGQTITGATSGATAIIRRVVKRSGTWSGGDAEGYMSIDTQTGTFTAAENINIGANPNVFTITANSTAITLPPGGRYEFINYNFYGAANLIRMYGANGVGKAFEYDGVTLTFIETGMPVDTPEFVSQYKRQLFLAYPGGSSQNSQVGEPLLFDASLGAAEIAIGDEITGYIPDNAGALTILGQNSIYTLYGNDAADFQLEALSNEAGALRYTAQKLASAIYMDNRGVRSMTTTAAFGNFSVGTLSEAIQPLLDIYKKAGVLPVASCRVRGKTHYRLFFSDMSGITIYLGKKYPEILPFNIGRLVTCIASVEDTDHVEKIIFGSSDGFVYELESGTSFDGDAIPYYLRLPFNHEGAPQVLKRWHKAIAECVAPPAATLNVSADFDYGDPDTLSFDPQTLLINGGGGFWDVSSWDTFYWSSPVVGQATAYLDGVGKNMSLLLAGEAADETPHLLQGVTLFFTVRGLRR